MKKKISSIIQYVVFLSIGIGLLYYVYEKQDFQKIIYELKNANYFWVILSMMAGLLSHLARAIRWNLLIAPLGFNPKTSNTFYAVLVGYFANFAIPRVGEIVRCGIVKKQEKVPLDSLIGTVILERGIDFICLILVIILAVFLQFSILNEFLYNIILNLKTSFYDNSKLLLWVLLFFVISIIGSIIIYKIFKKSALFLKLRKIVIGFITGLKSIKKIKSLNQFLFLTFFIWVSYVLMIYFCFFSLQGTSHLTFIDAITIMSIGSIGIVAPVPGGIGTYHGIIILLLMQLFAIDQTVSSAFAAISHSSQMVMIFVTGGISLFLIFIKGKKSLS